AVVTILRETCDRREAAAAIKLKLPAVITYVFIISLKIVEMIESHIDIRRTSGNKHVWAAQPNVRNFVDLGAQPRIRTALKAIAVLESPFRAVWSLKSFGSPSTISGIEIFAV